MNQITYSGDLIRRHDYDRYLASLFAPPDRRAALWALYAFNYEVARTREVVSNTTLGLIRLQWWRDAFAAIYEGRKAPAHEILRDLEPAIKRYELPREWFDNIVFAREFDLEDTTPANLQGLENYADFTGTPLLRLAAKIAGEADESVQDTAKAYTLVGLLRAVPFHASQLRCFLPMDLLAQAGLTPEKLYAGNIENISLAVEPAARRAETLAATRTQGAFANITAMQARLHLGRLRKLDCNPFDRRYSQIVPFYALRLWLGRRK